MNKWTAVKKNVTAIHFKSILPDGVRLINEEVRIIMGCIISKDFPLTWDQDLSESQSGWLNLMDKQDGGDTCFVYRNDARLSFCDNWRETCQVDWRVDGWVGGWVGGWMDEWVGGRMDEWVGGWMDGWMGGLVDGWMGGWVDEWVDGWMSWCGKRWKRITLMPTETPELS